VTPPGNFRLKERKKVLNLGRTHDIKALNLFLKKEG
jgi:hypothetical protein